MTFNPAESIIFTDLDGTLLDHHNYSYQAASGTLAALQQHQVPIVFNTSKTKDEVLQLRAELGNTHPFIVENGSAVFMPQDGFEQPAGSAAYTDATGSYWLKRFGRDREELLHLIAQTAEAIGLEEGKDFATFSAMMAPGIAKATSLKLTKAELANRRVSSEPISWLGENPSDRATFLDLMQQAGCRLIEGGRFLHVLGKDCSKGRAMDWLMSVYQQKSTCSESETTKLKSIALGDGGNDRDMLEASDYAIVIRPAKGKPLQLNRHDCWEVSDRQGPEGWSDCLDNLLAL